MILNNDNNILYNSIDWSGSSSAPHVIGEDAGMTKGSTWPYSHDWELVLAIGWELSLKCSLGPQFPPTWLLGFHIAQCLGSKRTNPSVHVFIKPPVASHLLKSYCQKPAILPSTASVRGRTTQRSEHKEMRFTESHQNTVYYRAPSGLQWIMSFSHAKCTYPLQSSQGLILLWHQV